MEVKISRSQYKTLILRRRRFRIAVRGVYTPEQIAMIDKYHLWNQMLYASEKNMQAALAFEASKSFWAKLWSLIKLESSLKIRVKDLIRGKRINCKDLHLLQKAESEVLECAKNVLTYIAVAETFDGRELFFEVSI
jgi:hypothetical protein